MCTEFTIKFKAHKNDRLIVYVDIPQASSQDEIYSTVQFVASVIQSLVSGSLNNDLKQAVLTDTETSKQEYIGQAIVELLNDINTPCIKPTDAIKIYAQYAFHDSDEE